MSGARQNISSGSRFEAEIGYSRAVRVGQTVYISGCTGFDYEAGTIAPDPAAQVRQVIANIEAALGQAGAALGDIVQLVTYVTDASVMAAITPELKAAFGAIGPTNAAVVVAFPFPDIKVEISATAIIGCGAR